MKTAFKWLSFIACCIAMIVIMKGAYVRLSDAGLGCPDWPGCYGHIAVPNTADELAAANENYTRPVEPVKAWKEMIHRYLASFLGLVILGLLFLAYGLKKRGEEVSLIWPWLLVTLVIFQGLLGMWTVTLNVKPAIVTAHLIFGFATAAGLWSLFLSQRSERYIVQPQAFRSSIILGLLLLIGQIFLGGWVSTNYSALACITFPGCNIGNPWPKMDFSEGFVLWRGLGQDYEFGVLDSTARMAVHMTHRLGAVIVGLYWLWLSIRIIRNGTGSIVIVSGLALLLITLQWGLGISNILMSLPIAIAVAHNGVAALLVLTAITLLFYAKPPSQN